MSRFFSHNGYMDSAVVLAADATFSARLQLLEKRVDALQRFECLCDRLADIRVRLQTCRELAPVEEETAAFLYARTGEESRGRMSAPASFHSRAARSRRIQAMNVGNEFQPGRSSDPWSTSNGDFESSFRDGQHYENGRNACSLYKEWCQPAFRKNDENEANKTDNEVHSLWNTQIQFFLSCLGFIVGVGNMLRFPAMIYQHGGIFFVPYAISLCVFGFPLVYLHLCIGQYSGLSVSGAFRKMMPISNGIGWALVLLAFPVSVYYNASVLVIVSWSLSYLWYSLQGIFKHDLPWSHCYSYSDWRQDYPCCKMTSTSVYTENFTTCFEHNDSMTSPEAFFHYQMLNRTSTDFTNMGKLQVQVRKTQFLIGLLLFLQLVVPLAFAWCLVCLGVFKGIGVIGWTTSFTATIPYFILVILLIRGSTLEGASKGLRYLFYPDFEKLWNIKIWKAAAEQIFYELGIDAGPLISMASFSRYRNNVYRDAFLLVVINSLTSVLCATAIFQFLGFQATAQGRLVNATIRYDQLYLAFTAYPGVTSTKEAGWLWAALFFGMVTLSALDAEFAWSVKLSYLHITLKMISASIMDQFGTKSRQVETRLLVGLCVIFFLLGLPLVHPFNLHYSCVQGGIFIFHSIENLNANWNSFTLSLLTLFVVCYIYGVDSFLVDVGRMLRVKQPPTQWSAPWRSRWYVLAKKTLHFFGPTGNYIKYSWCLFSPLILTVSFRRYNLSASFLKILFVLSVAFDAPIRFRTIELPPHFKDIAFAVMIGPLFVIPLAVGYTIYVTWRSGKVGGREKRILVKAFLQPWNSMTSTENWRNEKDWSARNESQLSFELRATHTTPSVASADTCNEEDGEQSDEFAI
ncbi:Sodium-and chloride-dependent glycine transporter 2 [Aphelenchoides fujianensis]|nr:Sodium-and chloride-dependent glycine transporter 2 [Aphelenchoides fujianensis]